MQKRIKEANLVLLITVILSIMASAILEIIGYVFKVDFAEMGYTWQLVYSQVIFVLPAFLYLAFVRKSFKVLRFKKVGILTILLCVLLYICLHPILTLANLVSQLYSSNLISGVMFNITDEVPFAVGLLMIAIIPAVFEEATYRGFVYNTLREKSPIWGILLCGLIFGLMHGNLNQFTYAFLLGMIFAVIVEATDSLWSTITIHFLINMSSVVILYVLPRGLELFKKLYDSAAAEGDTRTMDMIVQALGSDEFTMESILGMDQVVTKDMILDSIVSYIIPAIIGGVLAFLLLRLIAKRCGRWEIICGMFKKKQPVIAEAQPIRYTEGENVPTDENGVAVPVPQTSLIPDEASGVRIFTWELIAALIILVLQLAGNEVLLRFAATLAK